MTSSSRTRAPSPAARRPSSHSPLLVTSSHNLLLLDEPTNNLDPPSRAVVGAALRDWKGAMVIVSHDTEFVTELAPDRVLLMPEGVLDYWSDDLLDLVALGKRLPEGGGRRPPEPGQTGADAGGCPVRRMLVLAVVGAMLLAACGGDDDDSTATKSTASSSRPREAATRRCCAASPRIDQGRRVARRLRVHQGLRRRRPPRPGQDLRRVLQGHQRRGGINGRKIEPVFKTYCPIPGANRAHSGSAPPRRRTTTCSRSWACSSTSPAMPSSA